MIVKKLPFLFLVFLMISACTQETTKKKNIVKNDSLALYLKKSEGDIPRKIKLDYTLKALKILRKENNDSMNRADYFKIAGRFWNINDTLNYRKITQILIKNSENAGDTSALGEAYAYMGDYYTKAKKSDSTYYFYDVAEKLFRKSNDNENFILMLLNKAKLQHEFGDFLGCERTGFEMLRILKIYKSIEMEFQANNLLGIVYGDLQEYNLSKKYYSIALKLANHKNIPEQFQYRALILNNLGFMYSTAGKYQDAKEQFSKALQKKNLYSNRPEIFANVIDNLGYAEFKLGNFQQLPEMFYKALKIKDSLQIVPDIILSKLHLSEYFAFKKDTINAFKYANEALHLAKSNHSPRDVIFVLRHLVKIDPSQAQGFANLYYKISDSLDTAERKMRNKFARIEFETDNLIEQKKQLEIERDQKDRKLITAVSLFTLAFLLLIVIYLLNRQRLKNRELRLIRQQHDANEEIYRLLLSQQQQLDEGKQQEKKRIAKELHDGVMGRLTSIRLNLFVLGKKQDPETIQKALGHIDDIREVEKEIRSIAYDLGTNAFDGQADFLTIVRSIFHAMENHSGTRFVLQADDTIDWQVIDGHTKMQLYRILQEALQNIVKYAQASEVTVSMQKETTSLVITVSDDGVGFDLKQVKKGFGLSNMKERAKELGGKLKIQSEPKAGTTIKIIIPFISHE